MIAIVKVSGESMAPDFLHGDYLFVRKFFRARRIQPGEDVVVLHQKFGPILKRVALVDHDANEIECRGISPQSTPQEELGRVKFKDIYGLPFFKISR